MKKRRQWTTYSGSGKRVAPRTRTSRVSRGKEMGVPRLWVQLIVCGALFVALIGLKLLMPGNLSALRGTLGQWLVRDADFISAFSAVGRAASGEQDWGDSLSEASAACFADGTVGTVGESNILGNYVTVNHEGGFSTLYAHCSAITASAGQSVKKGDAIAKVGSTGNATGSHLHFEVHDGEEYLNPVYYVVP